MMMLFTRRRMNSSGTMSYVAAKPVVVLAGWLGCQPRYLRRYSEMYNRIGWQTVVRIGNPQSVMAALTEGPSWNDMPQSGMKRLSLDLLQELRILEPPKIVFHLFSNNGCFLWEWIRHFLFEHQYDLPTPHDSSVVDACTQQLKNKVAGVIFDSAPAYFNGSTSDIQSAFQYLDSPSEKDRMLEIVRTLEPQKVKQRFDAYWNGLLIDPTTIPQLYLFSERDALSSSRHIKELIEYRTNLIGKEKIWKHEFSDSEHCAHLLSYPLEYQESVSKFLSFCNTEYSDSHKRSKL